MNCEHMTITVSITYNTLSKVNVRISKLQSGIHLFASIGPTFLPIRLLYETTSYPTHTPVLGHICDYAAPNCIARSSFLERI